MEIDYAIAWQFVDSDGRPWQMRFRFNSNATANPDSDNETGQLIGVAVDPRRPNSGDETAISRPDVVRSDIDAALNGWQDWASIFDGGSTRMIDLTKIRRRIRSAGLGPG